LKILLAAGFRREFPLLLEKRKVETLCPFLRLDRYLLSVRLFSPRFKARGRDERTRHNRVAAKNNEICGDVNQSFVENSYVNFQHHSQYSREKQFKNSPLADKVIITVFWDCEGVILVDAMPRRETKPTPTSGRRKNSESVSKEFVLKIIQQKSCFSMEMQDRTKSEDSGSHDRIWLDNVIASTLQPRSSTLGCPSIWSPEGCNPRYEI
jgi:hypothetical protein